MLRGSCHIQLVTLHFRCQLLLIAKPGKRYRIVEAVVRTVFLPRSLLGVGGDSVIKKHHMFRGQFVLFLTMQANVLS